MSSKGDHPTKGQASVPPKPPGHDQLPLWKRMTGTSKRFIKRDPQLAPLAVIALECLSTSLTLDVHSGPAFQHLDLRSTTSLPTLRLRNYSTLGTIGLFYYFQHTKVSEVAKDAGLPRHNESKASGRGSAARALTSDASSHKGNYHAESGSTSGGIASYFYPQLNESERADLDNVTVPAHEGAFGRTMKQAAVRDQKRKDRDFEERLKQQQDVASGRVEREPGDAPARSKDHLADLQGHKRTV